MALIDCQECGREISDQAAACPHCARPQIPTQQTVRTMRAGAPWEMVGFLGIAGGTIVGIAGYASLAVPLILIGLVVFVIGRFN